MHLMLERSSVCFPCFFFVMFLQEGLLLPRKYVVPAAKYPSVRSMVQFTSCNVEVCKLRNLVASLMLDTSIMMTWLVSLEFYTLT